MSDTNTTNEKTPNEISQTLFRFVSLRNPQLADTSEKNKGFVIRPNGTEGVFDTQIESWATQNPKNTTKFEELELAAATFEEHAFKKEKSIELLPSVSDYYKLGKSLANNEDPDSDIIDRLTTTEALKIDNSAMISLWDNLIYQVVTQKDFYVKEAVIQTLKAVHYIDTYKTSEAGKLEKSLDLAKTAKVVLPAKLFVEDAPVETGDNIFTIDKTVIGNGDHITDESSAARILPVQEQRSLSVMQESRLKVEAEKNLRVTNALLKKDMTQSLKKELENLQKAYNKSYNKEYQTAYDEYQIVAKPIIDSNNTLLNDLEATFDENTTEAEKKAAYEQLELAEVPKFEFNFKNAINFYDLNAKLSTESFNLFIELFAEYDAEAISNNIDAGVPQDLQIKSDTEIRLYGEKVTLSDDYLSLQDIYEKVNEEVSTQSKTVLSTVEMRQQQYVNLGGALVPVAKTSTSTPFSYSLITYYSKINFITLSWLQFSFEVENESWSVAKAKFTATTPAGNHLEQTHLQIAVTNNKILFPNTFFNQFRSLSELKIEIYFDNGREATLEFQSIGSIDARYGVLTLKPLSSTTSGNGMTPKHFGVKRLGIADYLKVEQSVHAYVPGEVSNIENVMASELRHKSSVSRDYSEITDTTSKSQETEQISDTTKATRTDMQTEVAKEIEKQQNWEANTRMSGKAWGWSVEVGGSYANSTAQHDSTRQAVAKSQELTERAMERVLTKVSEERIQKIIKEHTETNVHEFDNRGKVTTTTDSQGAKPQHITGVYRWVDKKMKNQIYNYGKRTMFEFMIPEPARLHRLATQASGVSITAPIDPRSQEAGDWQMADYKVDETFLEHWAQIYGVKLTQKITKPTSTVHFPIDGDKNRFWHKLRNNGTFDEGQYSDNIVIPENLALKTIKVNYGYELGWMQTDNFNNGRVDLPNVGWGSIDYWYIIDGLNIEGNYPFKYQGHRVDSCNFSFDMTLDYSDTYLANWKQENFDAIIAAYTTAKEKFDADVKAATEAAAATAAEKKEKLTNYFREIENNLLKQNCIAYLLQDYLNTLGTGFDKGSKMEDFQILLGDNLDKYTSLAKFMEQAFEWTVMDYTFYPYYWANRSHWQEMYLTEETDPLFRNFLQAGMARVIVTVKPGFEDAVNFFMTTGRIWNGGEVPVIGDPMYMSIVEELRQPMGKPQGKYWITRVPTALTILQAGSVGLKVDDALPIFKEDHPEECENPLELEYESAFKPVDAVMEHGTEGSTLPRELTTIINK